jgi:uncharacterized membrane protein
MLNKYSYIFALIYIIIDLLYINLNKNFYNNVVYNIQSKNITTKKYTTYVALLAYLILYIGWLYFIANNINKKSTYKNTIILSILYSLVIYGVFNTTLYVLFVNWDIKAMLVDMTWGISWITLISIIYLYVIKLI